MDLGYPTPWKDPKTREKPGHKPSEKKRDTPNGGGKNPKGGPKKKNPAGGKKEEKHPGGKKKSRSLTGGRPVRGQHLKKARKKGKTGFVPPKKKTPPKKTRAGGL